MVTGDREPSCVIVTKTRRGRIVGSASIVGWKRKGDLGVKDVEEKTGERNQGLDDVRKRNRERDYGVRDELGQVLRIEGERCPRSE